MILRAVVDSVSDGTGFQSIKATGLADSPIEGEHMQPGGLSHVATAGAEGIALAVGGDADHTVWLCVSNRGGRPTGLLPGETALYTVGASGGVKVLCNATGEVLLGGDDAIGYVALAAKVDIAIATMLASGIGLTGTDAFLAAAASWATLTSNPITDTAATKVKAK